MTKLDWQRVEGLRCMIERYNEAAKERDAINIPMYDQFVTEVRKDWEDAGFDLTDATDLYKLWGVVAVVLDACAQVAEGEFETPEENDAVSEVVGTFGNMTGMFLREMGRHNPDVPKVHTHDEEAE